MGLVEVALLARISRCLREILVLASLGPPIARPAVSLLASLRRLPLVGAVGRTRRAAILANLTTSKWPLEAAICLLVEVGGIEPPSGSAPQSGLHA